MIIDYSSFTGDELERTIKQYLITVGYCVVERFPLDDVEVIQDEFLKICSSIGKPIEHDSKGKIIWDIKSEPIQQQKKSKVITFSQHNHEADLHTDSQYSEYPEDYFALLTLCQAECGGGQSFILSLKEIIQSLNTSKIGKKHLSVLRSSNFPFIIPSVFKRNNDSKDEYNFGPIIKGNSEIRYRYDTIAKAFDSLIDFGNQEMRDAFKYLVECINNHPKILRFYLKKGDCIFINNKTMLHGRTAYTDYNRHLLRIRMNDRFIEN